MSDERVRRLRGRSAEYELFPKEAERFKLNGEGPGGGRDGLIEGVEGEQFS